MPSLELERQLNNLPSSPGVYLLRDDAGNVIYVGKAASLAGRVRSYFSGPTSLSTKVQQLVSRIESLDYVVTGSDQEAVLHECNLIKKYRPRYNVRLKDDKTFPYLKISVQEDFPRVWATRRKEEDGALYFGPFASAGSVRRTLRLLKRIFPFRSCRGEIDGSRARPCLNYFIKRCLGPCVGAVDREEYRRVIQQVILFLEGKQDVVVRQLRENMTEAVEKLEFEKAAVLRDGIRAVESVMEGQRIAMSLKGDQDVLAVAQDGNEACVEVFFIRNGKLAGRDQFMMEGAHGEAPGLVMTNFVKQYYASASQIPPVLTVQHGLEDAESLAEWLRGRRGGRVRVQVPVRGARKKLVVMVAHNARNGLELFRARQPSATVAALGLEELRAHLALSQTPMRIECFDVSDIHGSSAVGSMVVLEGGMSKKKDYRRFRIRLATRADDYAMIREVVRRRLERAVRAETKEGLDSWWQIPDLILIDGGKGHLRAALEARREVGMQSVPVAALAKEREEIFVPGNDRPIVLPRDSTSLHILQRARDEAHRFAVSYHRKLRTKTGVESRLETVPGIGPKRRKALLRRFGSLRAIADAREEELAAVKGMTRDLACRVKECLASPARVPGTVER